MINEDDDYVTGCIEVSQIYHCGGSNRFILLMFPILLRNMSLYFLLASTSCGTCFLFWIWSALLAV